jgi:hypothetical protein
LIIFQRVCIKPTTKNRRRGNILLLDASLSPTTATILFVIACMAGIQYRRTWKQEGPKWQLWLYGAVAAAGLLALAFLPLTGAR